MLISVTALAVTPHSTTWTVATATVRANAIPTTLPPDTVTQARWRIQPTAPVVTADLDSSAIDLKMPENVKQEVEYDDSLGVYYIGSKLGSSYLNAPVLMTPEEYMLWTERRARQHFFRKKDAENVKQKLLWHHRCKRCRKINILKDLKRSDRTDRRRSRDHAGRTSFLPAAGSV